MKILGLSFQRFYFVKASFTLSRCTPRCVLAVCSRGPGRSGTNRKGIRVCSYFSGIATDQTRFGAKSDHGLSRLCYSLQRYIPGEAPVAIRCVPVRPDKPWFCPGHQRQCPGVSQCFYDESRNKDGKIPVL